MLIENLISNGIKYAKSRPEPSFLVVNIFETGNYLNIIVKDNGIGIAKEKQTKVFDMFYRAHENSDGSGLGLYIVKEMIQKMEGSFELESDVLKGTIFKIELPLTKHGHS
jgi:signal transduction histidine kinase